MPQNQASGRAAAIFGLSNAREIAKAIGASMVGRGSNVATYKGSRIVIKSAKQHTSSVGVTHKMLGEIDAVFGSFEQPDGSFTVISLPARRFAACARPTRSTGASQGKVGIVSRSAFENEGTPIKTVTLPTDGAQAD